MRHIRRMRTVVVTCAVTAAAVGASATAGGLGPPTLKWEREMTPGTAFRGLHDPARNVTIFLDGFATWEWTGAGDWEMTAPLGPLEGASVVRMWHDGAAGAVFAIGSRTTFGTTFPELWRYDLTGWTVINEDGPPATGAAFDSTRGVLVKVSNTGSAIETWEWDGDSWSLEDVDGVPATTRMAFDGSRGVTVAHVGAGAVWEWDGAAWVERIPATPGPSSLGWFEYDESRQRIIGFKWDFDIVPDERQVWVWDGVDWQRDADAPAHLARSARGWYDSARGSMMTTLGTFGVESPGEANAIWSYDDGAWAEEDAGRPGSRFNVAMAYDSVRQGVVLGPGESGGGVLHDSWLWGGERWENIGINNVLIRQAYAMAFDRARGVMVISGGNNIAAQTVEWDGAVWSAFGGASPPSRVRNAMVFDEARGVCVMYGGHQPGVMHYSDTWEFDGAAWSQIAGPGPSARREHGMAYDAARGVTVLFGGRFGAPLGDTWEYDGTAWTLRAMTGPSARYGHAMAYDRDRGVVVLHGGAGSTILSDVWEWDGATWREVATSGPARSEFGHGMAYDESRGALFIFGGHAPTDFSGTYRLRVIVCPADLDGDGAAGSSDLAILLGQWGASGSSADLDGDGTVGSGDLSLLLGSWGGCA